MVQQASKILQENYFELFDIPLSFDIDADKLEEVYLKLQQSFHPDNYASADVLQKSIAAKKSSLINIAYKELLNPTKRATHLLKLIPGINTASLDGEQTIDDTDFLMEQMQWREKIEESVDAHHKLQQLLNEIELEQHSIYKDFARLYDEATKGKEDKDAEYLGQDELAKFTAMVTKMQYFAKLEQDIKSKL